MNPERWEQIERLYHSALERAPGERTAFLDRACAGDDTLRRQVTALLASDDRAEGFIESPALQVAVYALAANSHEPTYPANVAHTIGAYQLLAPLGRGGMGEVYLALDSRLERKVAIKLLPAEFTADADRVRRFAQEARSASALNHPNIITIYEIGEAAAEVGGAHYIVTEYVDGETLRERMSGAPLRRMKLSEAIDVAAQTAAALVAAHGAGITHRDIKPENVMVRRDGYVKVLDFGLAKLTETVSPAIDPQVSILTRNSTEAGLVMGTPRYMSPEQARGEKVDVRSDLFSLGVVLYEMAAGVAPFTGASVADVLVAILEREPLPLACHAADLPAELERIVNRCLAKQREHRYQSAQELLADLRALAAQMSQPPSQKAPQPRRRWLLIVLLSLSLAAIGFFLFRAFTPDIGKQIESIAILPFRNESGNNDVEYLSDGMTESLINSLSKLPHLAVKARSSVYRYKDKQLEPQTIASDLLVQAILNGRVVQRGDNLTLYLSLVDGRNGNQLWGEQYDRKMTDLVALQTEITRDVSRKLRSRLSGADEQKLAKKHTAKAEAYQLYLKGRYHVLKVTRPEIERGISYFQQAIDIDPAYALAHIGLADGYRTLSLAGEMPPMEVLPKGKVAAQRAIDIDDTLAEAHTLLGYIIFWYDWDWTTAENQLRRALDLDPNSGDTHWAYAHFLSNSGRHAEALAQNKRALELEPLNLRTNALEGQFLHHAGRADEAIAVLQKTFQLDANYWLSHQFACSAYIEKGRFAEAVTEARKARDYSGASTIPAALAVYALAKSGKQAEARAELAGLLKLSAERYISPYNIALAYNGLDERDQALAWLERACDERNPRMTFLKVEPKWNNLRSAPRFQDLMRRVGFAP